MNDRAWNETKEKYKRLEEARKKKQREEEQEQEERKQWKEERGGCFVDEQLF